MKLLSYQPRQKIKYSGGFVSLLLLPVFCLWWIHNFRQNQIQHALDIKFYDPEPAYYLPEYHYKLSVPQKYLTLTLTDNDAVNKHIINTSKKLLINLKQKQDATTGVEIKFTPKTRYATFINVFDMFKTVGLINYINRGNSIHCFWNFPQPVDSIIYNANLIPCGNIVLGTQEYRQLEKTAFTKDLFKEFWMPAIAYLSMALFTITSLYKLVVK